MKSLILGLLLCLFLVSCGSSDDVNNQNRNIPNVTFDTGILINTNFPIYQHLTLPGNHLILDPPFGFNGTVLYHAGNGNYSAFELTDPSHQATQCSALTVDGIFATCGCEDNNFEIVSGLPANDTESGFPLKRYFVEVSGNIIRVFNN